MYILTLVYLTVGSVMEEVIYVESITKRWPQPEIFFQPQASQGVIKADTLWTQFVAKIISHSLCH